MIQKLVPFPVHPLTTENGNKSIPRYVVLFLTACENSEQVQSLRSLKHNVYNIRISESLDLKQFLHYIKETEYKLLLMLTCQYNNTQGNKVK
jgi:hypothetical protein